MLPSLWWPSLMSDLAYHSCKSKIYLSYIVLHYKVLLSLFILRNQFSFLYLINTFYMWRERFQKTLYAANKFSGQHNLFTWTEFLWMKRTCMICLYDVCCWSACMMSVAVYLLSFASTMKISYVVDMRSGRKPGWSFTGQSFDIS